MLAKRAEPSLRLDNNSCITVILASEISTENRFINCISNSHTDSIKEIYFKYGRSKDRVRGGAIKHNF